MSFFVASEAYRSLVSSTMRTFFERERAFFRVSAHPHIAEHFDRFEAMCLSGWKMLRPILSCLFFEGLSGRKADEVIDSVIAFELFHNYTLVHDDIYDEDAERRGNPVIHAQFLSRFSLENGVQAAYGEVLYRDAQSRYGVVSGFISGKILFSLGQKAILSSKASDSAKLEALALYSNTAIYDNIGQALDLSYEAAVRITEGQYRDLSHFKTGKLIEASALLGAILADSSDLVRSEITQYARSIALAFQIKDDLLDIGFWGEKGRERGSDIRKAKKTLLFTTLFERLDAEEAAPLRAIFGNVDATDGEIDAVVSAMERLGVLEAVSNEGRRCVEEALLALEKLKPRLVSSVYENLIEFTQYVWQRNK